MSVGRSLALLDPQRHDGATLITPALILPTEFGIIPYTTPDQSPIAPLYLSAGDFLDNSLPHDLPLLTSLGQGTRWCFLGPASDFNNFDDGPTPDSVKLRLRNGDIRKLTLPVYSALVSQVCPQGVVQLHSRILPGSSHRQQHLRKQISSTLIQEFEHTINFTSAESNNREHALFFHCGQFGEIERAEAVRLIGERPAGLPRMILFDGHPADVRAAVYAGFDLLIAKMPLYCAQRGVAVTFAFENDEAGEIGICLRDPEFRDDHRPVDSECDCKCCTGYQRSYLHHLLVVHELTGMTLLVHHNVRYFQRFLEVLRKDAEEQKG